MNNRVDKFLDPVFPRGQVYKNPVKHTGKEYLYPLLCHTCSGHIPALIAEVINANKSKSYIVLYIPGNCISCGMTNDGVETETRLTPALKDPGHIALKQEIREPYEGQILRMINWE